MLKDNGNPESAGSAGVESMEYEEFHKYMEVKYPKMFDDHYGGFATGRGWWKMLDILCGRIQSWTDFCNRRSPDSVAQVKVEQIKEKFGTLRFYYEGGDDHIAGLVDMAESMSAIMCEECGAHGHLTGKGWIRTLCDIHSIP